MSNYDIGFRNGRLDAMLGITLLVALRSNLPGCSAGYHDGQIAWRNKP